MSDSYFNTVLTDQEKHEITLFWRRIRLAREERARNFDPSAPTLKSSYPGRDRPKYNRKIAGRRKFIDTDWVESKVGEKTETSVLSTVET